MSKRYIAVYPGSFDPLTNGHWDIITRAVTHLCNKLIIGVATNTTKTAMFNKNERVDMIAHQIQQSPDDIKHRMSVKAVDGLLVDFAQQHGAAMIIRGIRALSDFDSEFQMGGVNAKLNRDIQTVFLMADENHQFISSRFIKEIARLNGDISDFVPAYVAQKVNANISR